MDEASLNASIDPCSQWIHENQGTIFKDKNTSDMELEWLRICVGPQRFQHTFF